MSNEGQFNLEEWLSAHGGWRRGLYNDFKEAYDARYTEALELLLFLHSGDGPPEVVEWLEKMLQEDKEKRGK